MYIYMPSSHHNLSGILRKKMNPFIFLVSGLFLFSGIIYADTPRGKMGGLTLHKGSAQISENSAYVLELFPGQSFDGWWYFWSGGDPVSAQLEESPEVSWLSVSPSTFTSTSCRDIINVTYSFTAPTTPGQYTTTIIDQNGNWEDHPVELYVRDAPYSAWEEYVELSPDQTYTYYDSIYFTPFTDMGCLDYYIPGSSGLVNYSLVPAVTWLTITPSQFTITNIDTIVVEEIFSHNVSGDYSCYEVWTAQYFTWPEYTQWNLSVLSDISDPNTSTISTAFALYQNFPNPFNPETTIRYSLRQSGNVTLKIYDLHGQEVRSLVSGIQPVGSHSTVWDGCNNLGQPVANGIYIYRIETGNFTSARKMILIR
jgi:hypothetical protein